ncbi:TonB-dependent siderophore receptor [Reinekea blandensis]|uniref:Ferrichrome-iron receptor n=1 Tax=Reinekea blandensis MED297 TaxID=314283 RepID=A4BA45_9GAMM|nr:TonB-dependent siderophore receptor [Reinekea blandensis]EAR10801.1 ferrichrome-iron receptor [Reinekea sp. MED297] [Reinekea blandensis MED297]
MMLTQTRLANTTRRYTPLALTLSAVVTLSPTALANEVLDLLEVTAEVYRNTATKTALEPEETPQGISVIDGDQIKAHDADTLSQALRYAPGVTTEVRGGAVTLFDTFTIRGFGVNRSYYDGLVLPYLNGWNLQAQIDPVAIEQVEVFKGPTSVLYGTMPPGGMVNIISRAPTRTPETQIDLSAGSHQHVSAAIDTAGALGNTDLSYRLIAKGSHRAGQVDTTEEQTYLIAPSVDWQVSERTLINLNAYYQNDPAMGMNSAIPASGMLYDNPNGTTDPTTFVGDKNWNKLSREVFRVGYKLSHTLADDWTFLHNGAYTDASLAQKNTYHRSASFDENTGTLGRNIYSTDETLTGLTLDNQLSGRLFTGPVEHNLLLGLDYQQLKGNADYREFQTSNSDFYLFNIFEPNNDLLDPDTLTEVYQQDDDVSVQQLGAYAQNQLRWQNLVLIAGARYDDYQSESIVTAASTTKTEADHQQWSYRVGALYELAYGAAPFASFATSFEPATGQDDEGNGYDPELGQQIEAGVKFVSGNEAVNLSGSYFHITKSDALVANPADPYGAQLQVGELVSKGVELGSRVALSPDWTVQAGYAYTDMTITDDANGGLEGKTPIWVPEHSAQLWTQYRLSRGWLQGTRLGGGVRYVGDMQIDSVNSDTVPASTVYDLSVGYELAYLLPMLDGSSINLMVNNVTDETTYRCYDTDNCWYGAERTVTANLNLAF